MIRLLLVAILAMAALSVQARGLLVLGDSISAAYGIEKSAGWVALLEKELEQRCRDFPVINASVSGETTAGGNARLAA
jgi:acyl-CoA thioesterase-1